jgi:uncharacterized membrane protein YeaQ/YmgE (transglycosylase-associated protein family)
VFINIHFDSFGLKINFKVIMEDFMTLINILILLLVAGLCGAIGQALTGYSAGGFLISIVIGFIGAFIGAWLADKLGLPKIYVLQIGTKSFPIVWSIIGAGLFVAVIGLITSPRRR